MLLGFSDVTIGLFKERRDSSSRFRMVRGWNARLRSSLYCVSAVHAEQMNLPIDTNRHTHTWINAHTLAAFMEKSMTGVSSNLVHDFINRLRLGLKQSTDGA